jgi:hypothetical protein
MYTSNIKYILLYIFLKIIVPLSLIGITFVFGFYSYYLSEVYVKIILIYLCTVFLINTIYYIVKVSRASIYQDPNNHENEYLL